MAEKGAHLTSVFENRPSIFEVLAQEGLIASLKPALRYTLKVLSQEYPAQFGVFFRYADELYLGLSLLLEQFYLKRYAASFSENFYGLKRVGLNCDPSSTSPLPSSLRHRSLFFLTLVPYVREKLNSLYEEVQDEEDNGQLAGSKLTFSQKLRRLFLRLYPYLHSAWELLHFSMLLSYVVGRSSSHSPSLYLSNVRLQHLTEDDIRNHLERQQGPRDFTGKSAVARLWLIFKYSAGSVAMGLSSLLSLFVFFLQFLQWWYASDSRVTSLNSLPIPQPPSKNRGDLERLPQLSSICPLCHRRRTNDTALAVSGYVFCYPCIYTFVRQHAKCPVTSFPATSQHLVRLYQDQT